MIDESVDGILLDLGLSSIQLEKEGRGFSFRGDSPLDMRMDQRLDQTAADLVNRLSLEELEYIISHYGEERWAKRIARAIIQEREREPIRTTEALRRVVYRAIPKRFHSRRIDPATRTFQALRIKVNEELENLKKNARCRMEDLEKRDESASSPFTPSKIEWSRRPFEDWRRKTRCAF